jgi:hypothetical protein
MPKYNGCHVIRRERKIDNYAETATRRITERS